MDTMPYIMACFNWRFYCECWKNDVAMFKIFIIVVMIKVKMEFVQSHYFKSEWMCYASHLIFQLINISQGIWHIHQKECVMSHILLSNRSTFHMAYIPHIPY